MAIAPSASRSITPQRILIRLDISSDDPVTAKPRTLAAGAAAFLHKPIAKEVLTQTVAELLSVNPPV